MGSKIVNSLLTSYTYDEIDQLKTENSSSLSNTYNYDNNGNRTSRISNAGTDTYTYDFADKLTGITRSYAANSTYTYDGCGRTATISGSGGTRMFTWDFEDRLTNLSGGGVPSTNYGYNGVGSRTSKSNTLGSRTYKRNGVGVTAPVLSDGVATMVPGISEKSGGVTSTILSDRMGSMKGLTNAGTVTDTAEFDAFGKVVSRTGTNATQKGFAGGFGYQEDGESGYKLLGHRYYDPETGRFLSRDPARDGRNWYVYCENRPTALTDPNGLDPQQSYAVYAGQAAGLDLFVGGFIRGRYEREVAKFPKIKGFNPERDALTKRTVLRSPRIWREGIDGFNASRGGQVKTGTGGNSNALLNRLGKLGRRGGGLILAATAIADGYQIAHSDRPFQTGIELGLGLAGGIAGWQFGVAVGGALLGGLLTPIFGPFGPLVGALLAGAIFGSLGGAAGEEAGGWLGGLFGP